MGLVTKEVLHDADAEEGELQIAVENQKKDESRMEAETDERCDRAHKISLQHSGSQKDRLRQQRC